MVSYEVTLTHTSGEHKRFRVVARSYESAVNKARKLAKTNFGPGWIEVLAVRYVA